MGSAPYAVSTLSLAVMAVPVLIIVWRILKIPFQSWMPILLFLGVILLIQGVSELVGRRYCDRADLSPRGFRPMRGIMRVALRTVYERRQPSSLPAGGSNNKQFAATGLSAAP